MNSKGAFAGAEAHAAGYGAGDRGARRSANPASSASREAQQPFAAGISRRQAAVVSVARAASGSQAPKIMASRCSTAPGR